MPTYIFTQARPRDLRHIATIERAAARMLAGHIPEPLLDEVTPLSVLAAAQAAGRLWVALLDDTPVGYAHVEIVEPNVAHLMELDVHPDHGRRGIGRRLVTEVSRWAGAQRCSAVTLTTFRDLPWNMPFYQRLGFDAVEIHTLSPALNAIRESETRRGLDPARRVVMRGPVTPPATPGARSGVGKAT
jgi:GNAT superfamily N-acetyltransferase